MSDFPHWPVRPVGDVFYVKGRIGWRNLRRSDFCEEGPYLITGMHIDDSGAVDWDACFRIPKRKFDESPEIQVQVGDLVITKDGTIGKVGRIDWLPGETSLNSHLFLVRPKRPEYCSERFAFHVFTSPAFRSFIDNQKSGSTLVGLGESKFVKFKFPVPRSSEQKLVSDILDSLDTVIHETEVIVAKLQAIKQGILQDLLTRGIDADGELRPQQAEAPHLYKKSSLGWIPKDWIVGGLASVAANDRAVIRTGPFGSSLKGKHWRESGTPVVTIGSLGDGVFNESELLFVDSSTTARLADFALIPGDLVFSRVADVGRSVAITEDQRGWIMSSNFMRISCNGDKVRLRFLQMLLSNSTLIRKQLRTTVNSAGRDVANSAVLLGLSFAWPSPAEQDEILSKVDAISERIVAEEIELRKLLGTKAGLMHDLLSGRVRITPLLAETDQQQGDA